MSTPTSPSAAFLKPAEYARRKRTASATNHPIPYFPFRYDQGGTGLELLQTPYLPLRASPCNPSSTVSPGAYFLYHQHHPSLTSSRLILAHGISTPFTIHLASP